MRNPFRNRWSGTLFQQMEAAGCVFEPISLTTALAIGSAAMTVVGGAVSAIGQQQAGETAYQNAVAKNQQLKAEADARERQGIADQAVAQRKAIEERRKGTVMASRAAAVMAAQGGGMDDRLIAGLLGQGEYGADVALYQGDESARVQHDQANLLRYEGSEGIKTGQATKSRYQSAALGTLVGSVASAGLSIAGKYADGPAPGATFKPVTGDITASSDWLGKSNVWRNPGLADSSWGNFS